MQSQTHAHVLIINTCEKQPNKRFSGQSGITRFSSCDVGPLLAAHIFQLTLWLKEN